MASNGLQQFAGGLFLATALIGGALYFTNTEDERAERDVEPTESVRMSTTDFISQLESENYIVLDEHEFNELQSQLNEPVATNSEEDVVEQQTVYVMILQITSGMTSNDIAEQLERGQIIESEQDFLSYVQSNELSHVLRTGQYEVTSAMTIKEIVELIT